MLGQRDRVRLHTDVSPADLVYGKLIKTIGDLSLFTNEVLIIQAILVSWQDLYSRLAARETNQISIDIAIHKVIRRNMENQTLVIEVNGT